MRSRLTAPTGESTDDATGPHVAPSARWASCVVAADDGMVDRGLWRPSGDDVAPESGRRRTIEPPAHRRRQRPAGRPPEARRALSGAEWHRDHPDVPVLGRAGAADQA